MKGWNCTNLDNKLLPFIFILSIIVLLHWIWASKSTAFPSIRLPITRDTWISSIGKEKTGSNGGTKRLKVKSLQEYTIIDIDPAILRGKIVTGARLHLRSASPQKAPLARLGVSSLASEWNEGSSSGYRPEIGSSSYVQAFSGKEPWTHPDSTFMDATFGRGNTRWKFADCTSPDQKGWQTCAVDTGVVAARVAGISYGFSLYDEVGSTWSIRNGQFYYNKFPNRFFYSRESGKSAPWLEVRVDGMDTIPPATVASMSYITSQLPAGQAVLEWETPEDTGGGKTIGFLVQYNTGNKTREIPRYLIPMARKAGEKVRMYLQDLDLKPGQEIAIIVRPVDSAGNVGKPFSRTIQVSSGLKLPVVDIDSEAPFHGSVTPIEIGGVKVSIMDLLEKIDPETGEMITIRKTKLDSKHLFPGGNKEVLLYSSRNETVWFQINLEGSADAISAEMLFPDHADIKSRLYQFAYVKTKNDTGEIFYLPDPLIPLKGQFSIPSSVGKTHLANQKNHSLICEIYVPHELSAGKKRGKLRLSTGAEMLDLDIDLTVWNFTLPNKLSFIPEMNAYSALYPGDNNEYYRLAHEHRACLNRLPYNWHGNASPAPEWDGNDFSFSEWDTSIAPLLDGSAFRGLPREEEPVDVFYLPFNENWPINLFENYKCSYWADEAFSEEYGNELQKTFSRFAEHFTIKGWKDTVFQFYLNNKVYYRKNNNKSSAPWIFDEPQNTQDFWALRWYGLQWQNAVTPYKNDIKLWFRGDISYSEFERNMLQGIMDVAYIGGNNAQKTRMKHDEQVLNGKSYFFEYGSANKIHEPNTQPVLWCLSAWSKGAMGVLPWQTIGTQNAWMTGEQTALFYPTPKGPLPSVRLKAFTYGQQLVEYLTLFSQAYGLPRYAAAKWLDNIIEQYSTPPQSPQANTEATEYQRIDLIDLQRLRYLLGEMISEKAPSYKRSLVNFKSPKFDPESLPDIGYVAPAPIVYSLKPECGGFRPE